MADPLVQFSTGSVTLDGHLFEGDAALRVKNALADQVGKLAEQTRREVVAGINTADGTGFTARAIEVHRRPPNSLYATIRMKPKLERAPGSVLYPATRRAYIVNAVLESGHYGNGGYLRTVRVSKSGRARVRKRWQSGKRTRPALRMWANAARSLRRSVNQVRADVIAKELV